MSIETTTRTLEVLHCSGSATERGKQHGEALRELIGMGVGSWIEKLGATHGIDPDAYLSEFLQDTGYRAAIERWTPELLLEVHGMAAGSGQSVDRLLVYSMLDEEWHYSQRRAKREAPGCTAVGVRAEGERATLIGQTMDIPSVHDGTQVVVIHEEQGAPTQAVFTAAGMVGLMGVNSAGLGLCVNNLERLPASQNGVPVTFLERKLLDTFTVEEASYALAAMPHSIGQHYLIGGPSELASFEADAERTIGGSDDLRVVAHANHPLYDPPYDPALDPPATAGNSRQRMTCMATLASNASTLDDIAVALMDTSAPISRAPLYGFMTFGAMVAELSSPPKARFAPGPPHLCPFVEIEVPAGGEVALS